MRTDRSPPRAHGARTVADAVSARDAGMLLARRAQRWIAALAVGAAGALAAFTAHAYHARAAAPAVTRPAPARHPVDDGGGAGATAPAAPLQPPAAAPVPAAPTDVAPVVSGGS